VDRAPVNAALVIRNGQVSVGQSTAGRKLDVPATAALIRAPRSLDDAQRVDLVVTTVPPTITDAGVAEARAMATKILAAPLTLRAAGKSWTFSKAALGEMIDSKPTATAAGTAETLSVSLNETKLAAYVRSLAADIDRPAVDAQLAWTRSGAAITRESQEGLKLSQPAAVKAISAQAAQDNRELALPVTVIKPAVTSESVPQLGIKDLVATGTSRFTGSSPERINNIKVASSRLHGTVIPAGTTFSFLDALGPITVENGYQEGLTILGDETVPGIGGGVCQVSTTVFRAAFFAGLPIVERHQHAYRVGYYEQDGSPVGFDAAVYDPGVDLRFKNDTGAALLLQSAVDPATSILTFRFYGTQTNREVKLIPSKANEVKAGPRLPDGSDPTLPKGVRKQVEWKTDGVEATIKRLILHSGQTLLSDSFFSRYAPWQEKWVIGTGPAA
jgi:vancomycin resistance protein YoaR